MSKYDEMASALNNTDEATALRVLREQPELAQRRFVGDRQRGHSAPLNSNFHPTRLRRSRAYVVIVLACICRIDACTLLA